MDNLLLIDCTLLKVNLKNNVARKCIYKEIPTSFTLTFDKFNLVHVSATYGFSILTYPVSSIELFTGPNWKNIKSLKRQIEQETQPRLWRCTKLLSYLYFVVGFVPQKKSEVISVLELKRFRSKVKRLNVIWNFSEKNLSNRNAYITFIVHLFLFVINV